MIAPLILFRHLFWMDAERANTGGCDTPVPIHLLYLESGAMWDMTGRRQRNKARYNAASHLDYKHLEDIIYDKDL